MHPTLVKVFDSGAEPQNLLSSLLTQLLHLTCGAGAVDEKDLTVSSNQGNTGLCI